MAKCPVCVQEMEFFLCLDGSERCDDVFFLGLVMDMIPINVVCDVGEELGEERYFSQLVESDEPEAVFGVFGDICRWSSVGKRPVCGGFDGQDSRSRGSWEAIS